MVSHPDWPLPEELQRKKEERDARFVRESVFVTNDHEQYASKLKYFTGTALGIGFVQSLHHLADRKRPWTYSEALRTIGRHTLPKVGMAITYPSTVKLVAATRGRDDVINHIVAGFVAGSIWGVKHGSQRHGFVMGGALASLGIIYVYLPTDGSQRRGFVMGGALATLGMIWKYMHKHNWELFGMPFISSPEQVQSYPLLGIYHYKMSFMPGEKYMQTEAIHDDDR